MRFKRIQILLTITLVALSSTAGFNRTSASSGAGKQSAARSAVISAERIKEHVNILASEKMQGRRTGTPAGEAAAKYIADQLRSYGLDTKLHPFEFVSKVELGPSNSFRMKIGGRAQALKVTEDFMPLAFSPNHAAVGDAIFIGYGISAPELQYDNYAGTDVKGKVVMILRGSPDGDNPHGRFAEFSQPGLEIQNKTLKAREKGASGVVFVSTEDDFVRDRLARLRHDLNFLDSSIPTTVISRKAADSILSSSGASLAALEQKAKQSASPLPLKAQIEFKTDVEKVNGRASNVVGILKGSDPQLASEHIVIGAHYDHLGLGGSESLAANPEGDIHHGADDNASGTSGLLELARVLASDRSSVKRSVVFIAFSGEEMGLLGSAAYTKKPVVPLASTVAMFNMDMIGRLRDGKLFVSGVGTSPAWKPLLQKLNVAGGHSVGNGSGGRFQMSYGEDGFGPSDHQSFYVRDVPVLFFFTGTHDDYHKPSDTADKINAEGLKQIAELVRDITVVVANEPQRIAFTRVKVESRPTGRGFRVYLGTVPNYSDQDDGMKLDGVRPGSPAEKAGLRAGDLVTKIGNIPIKNVYDYTYALGEMRAGEEIEVLIRRDGQEMRLKLTPEKRN